MSLEEKIMTDLKAAMLAKDEQSLRSLRAIKAAILNARTAEGSGGTLKEADEILEVLSEIVHHYHDYEIERSVIQLINYHEKCAV